MASKNRRTIFNHKGVTYIGTLRANKITVRAERTARGQNSVVGAYNIDERSWQNVKTLPKAVREHFELF